MIEPMELLDTTRWQAPSFTRMSYHTTEARKYWAPLIQLMNGTVADLEIRSIAAGLRSCGTIHIPNVDGDQTYRKLAEAGLKWKRLTKVGHDPGFSHRRHAAVQKGDLHYSWFSVMGRNQDDLDDFALAYEKSNHDLMGKLLGFPACCRRFFAQNWPKYCDPIWQSAANTEGAELVGPRTLHVKGHPGCNVMLRYIGVRTWFHLPCSLRCEETIALSESWLNLIREMDEASFEATRLLLSLPLAWDVNHGYAKVMTPAFTVHAGSTESRYRYVVEYEADPCGLPDLDIPGAANGLVWPMRPGDLNKAPLLAAGGWNEQK